MKNKLQNDDVKDLINQYDILILSETHFSQRIKCPDDFTFICRSEQVLSKKPRGGVALYKNKKFESQVEVICDNLRDCVVCQVADTDLTLAAVYIPPSNSEYYDEIYMRNMDLIYNQFHPTHLLVIGDMNARLGTMSYKNHLIKHVVNPDTTINCNGRNLTKWVEDNNDMILVNGFIHEKGAFDSQFTYHRGTLRSQNDLVFSNEIQKIRSFNILEKMMFSDHCPIAISCTTSQEIPLHTVMRCSQGAFNDNHYDVNRRIKPPINIKRVDVVKVIENLEACASQLKTELPTITSNNELSNRITSGIYDACKRSYSKSTSKEDLPDGDNFKNCTSSNFQAIANANLMAYNTYVNQCNSPLVTSHYIENWMKFEKLAIQARNDELNTKINKSWKDKKGDGKKLWECIDWKGKAEIKVDKPPEEAEIVRYFKSIFQSPKTKNDPVIDEVWEELETYDVYIPTIDDQPTMEELESACRAIGTGISIDGLPTKIVQFLPKSMKEIILHLIQKVFFGEYPSEWTMQILHSITKDGHTAEDPKLRGIAIAILLCRLYDIIIDMRFAKWYRTNPEQASQSGQGCLLQIFLLNMLIVYSKEAKKELYVGFLDFEKAYDYVNRANVIREMMKNGCGKALTHSIAKMFTTSTYYPKLSGHSLGEGIETSYGVTQGRRSSGNIFSFYISDMISATQDIGTDDFMDPINLAQLADDTATLAEKVQNLRTKLISLFQYSSGKYQHPNVKKTLYCHFNENPSYEPIILNDEQTINSIDKDKGYKYLGQLYFPTNDIKFIILRNFNKRKMHLSKFYAWLNVNETTPIEMKLMVLDSCVLPAILYASETWGDISFLEKDLLSIELKALKAILKVKSGTTNDLVYHELKRPCITAKIKDSQCKFFLKIRELTPEDAIVGSILQLCHDTSFIRYYMGLDENNGTSDIEEREHRIQHSTNSMCIYYRNMNFDQKLSCIYSSMTNDYYRYIITRWRLSNHDLKIETGRYTKPMTPRAERKCDLCNVIEDEHHVVFVCPTYDTVRNGHETLLSSNNISIFLDCNISNMKETATLLHQIEQIRKDK